MSTAAPTPIQARLQDAFYWCRMQTLRIIGSQTTAMVMHVMVWTLMASGSIFLYMAKQTLHTRHVGIGDYGEDARELENLDLHKTLSIADETYRVVPRTDIDAFLAASAPYGPPWPLARGLLRNFSRTASDSAHIELLVGANRYLLKTMPGVRCMTPLAYAAYPVDRLNILTIDTDETFFDVSAVASDGRQKLMVVSTHAFAQRHMTHLALSRITLYHAGGARVVADRELSACIQAHYVLADP
jgi:hypothetical protein